MNTNFIFIRWKYHLSSPIILFYMLFWYFPFEKTLNIAYVNDYSCSKSLVNTNILLQNHPQKWYRHQLKVKICWKEYLSRISKIIDAMDDVIGCYGRSHSNMCQDNLYNVLLRRCFETYLIFKGGCVLLIDNIAFNAF